MGLQLYFTSLEQVHSWMMASLILTNTHQTADEDLLFLWEDLTLCSHVALPVLTLLKEKTGMVGSIHLGT